MRHPTQSTEKEKSDRCKKRIQLQVQHTLFLFVWVFFFIKKSQSRGGHHFTSQPPKAPVNVKLLTCSSTFHSYLHSELSG